MTDSKEIAVVEAVDVEMIPANTGQIARLMEMAVEGGEDTIGALERIAGALEERSAHFVEEQVNSLAILTTRRDRAKTFTCDADDRIIEAEQLTQNVPWGMSTIMRHVTEPGDKCHRSGVLGETAALCQRGMVRITVGEDAIVLREGDTVQFPMDEGYVAENIGDARSECLMFTGFVTRKGW